MRTGYLLVLLVATVLLSGCAAPVSAPTPEEEAVMLADQTSEGRLAVAMTQSFANVQDCTVDEIISGMNEFSIATGGSRMPEATETVRTHLAEVLELAKKCTPSIEKEVTKTSESRYLVSYKYITPAGCDEQTMFSTGGESHLEIEVDTEADTTGIIKGKLAPEQVQLTQTMLETTGNCSSAVLMGMSSALAPLIQ